MNKKLTIGILAHVDAGKTTLSEALLYLSGRIRALGRVDHRTSYLDTNTIERERGITIFSKQARFSWGECDFILLDTPGHVDFSPEAERTLCLLDYAILVISGLDGVQNHTRTLWQLLEFYQIPTFLFVNKTDIAVKQKEELFTELASALSPLCVPFYEADRKAELDERLAVTSEDFLECFLSGSPIGETEIAERIGNRRLFPCLFGSALRTTGVEFLLDTLDRYTLSPVYDESGFGARVYKIARAGSTRLTYMKITSGALSVRDPILYTTEDGRRTAEKAAQLRLYSGDKFEQVDHAEAGEICAVVGLSETFAGQGLGSEGNAAKPILEPVLSYALRLPPSCDPRALFLRLKELEEEEPSLQLLWNDELCEIEARLMGEVQIELLRRLITERFSVECEFGAGRILYKERIAKKAIGIGHFEPLRHYAEVQLYMEPQPKGTGLVFDTRLPEDVLSRNWQRLILSHLYEKRHRGVLIGAALTDTRITLVAGKAHEKHTEGGDFREATLRAVRQGLMTAGTVLLEPYYKFRLEIPSASVGRAVNDLQSRSAEFEIEATSGDYSLVSGRAPVSELVGYAEEIISYTRGQGRLFCTSDGYEPCHNTEEIVAAAAYDAERDLENTPHSVFCAHGSGFTVPWNEVEGYKHLDAGISVTSSEAPPILPPAAAYARKYHLSDKELEAIMLREFGPIKRRRYTEPKSISENTKEKKRPPKAGKPQKRMLIVDGYNFIHASEGLRHLAQTNLAQARESLMDLFSSYVAYTKTEVTLVFDAYRVKDGEGSDFTRDGYRVVYTKADETADAFIERMMYQLGPNYNIRVVTGDRLLQFSAVHSGILRMTPQEFENELLQIESEISDFIRRLSVERG